jgi:type II secretory pathway pseudopilin PulG
MKKTFRGFTLIELAIVVLGISVLTGLIVPNLQHYIEDAERATDFANAALLYDDLSLVMAADDDAYISFYSGGNDGEKTCQYPIHRTKVVTVDGKKVVVEYWDKKSDYKTYIVTRCSGVDASMAMALAKRQGQGYDYQDENGGWHGLHDPWYDQATEKGKHTLYTWEPVLPGGTYGQKKNAMNRTTIANNVKNGTDTSQYFTAALSYKMNMPVWGDDYTGGSTTKYGNKDSGDPVDTSKSYFRMRYYKGYKGDKGGQTVDGNYVAYNYTNSDYCWEWMVTFNPDTLEPEIWAGNGQGNLVRKLYPQVDSDKVMFTW